MLISLSETMSTKGKVEKVSVPIEMESFDYQGIAYKFSRKEPVNLTISNLGNRVVLIEGNIDVSLTMFCSRCLKELEYPMKLDFNKEIDFNLTAEERADDLDETNYIVGYNLDVDIMVYDEILIAFPMKLLCSEDCKGLCKNCGANLNETTCDCDNAEYDPRMSKIRDIFNNFKEV